MSSCDSFMVDGSALFVENVYRPFKSDEEDHHYLNVGRVVGVLMVVGGILITEYFHSVISLWRFLVPLPAFWGIAVWACILCPEGERLRSETSVGRYPRICSHLGDRENANLRPTGWNFKTRTSLVSAIGGVSANSSSPPSLSPALPKERLDQDSTPSIHTPSRSSARAKTHRRSATKSATKRFSHPSKIGR